MATPIHIRISGTGWALLLAATTALGVACSASTSSGDAGAGSSGCNDDPFVCAPGETCWPKDYTPTFACMKSVPGKKVQDPCSNTPGSVACSDNQACVEFDAGAGGCLAYCSASLHPCPGAQDCVEIKVGSRPDAPAISVCAPPRVDAGPPDEDAQDAKVFDVRTELPN